MADILLVDDNAALLRVQGEFLRRARHAVTLAGNGREAMALANSHHYDLVITDLVMPEKEGIETIIELRQKFPGLKIIAMSGGGRLDAVEYLTLAAKLGAVKTLAKPFSVKELLEAVDCVLR